MSAQDKSAEVCPVDHKTRQLWLDKARAAQPQPASPSPPPPPPTAVPTTSPIIARLPNTRYSLDAMRYLPTQSAAPSRFAPKTSHYSLDNFREVSTIPRAQLTTDFPQAPGTHAPANNEYESDPDSQSGNWIYPSEQMFFDAMKRKNFDPQATDMKSIVPIHNAVNEQAWKEIKKWEKGRADSCGGPKLVSFSGQATALTPRARINSVLGYQPPFDRHDWVIDRCGTQVDYVIDFYAGKDEGKTGKSLNFYLDVRPKLNTLEGWKMRAGKFVGLW